MISSAFHTLQAFLSGDGALILPEIELLLFAVGILVIDRWLTPQEKRWNLGLALAGMAFGAFTLRLQYGKMVTLRSMNPESPGLLGFHQAVLVDPFFVFFAVLLVATTILVMLLSDRAAEVDEARCGRFYASLLLACAGLLLIVSGVNVIVVFLGLQLAATSCYLLLCACNAGGSSSSAEKAFAAVWACASVCLALGFLLLYGEFQTTNLGRVGAILDTRLDHGVSLAGLTTWHAVTELVLVAAGTFFLLQAAPVHWLIPRAYESGCTPVISFVDVALKTAGCALLLRLFAFLFLFAHERWMHLWGGVAILSMLGGNILALRRKTVMGVMGYGSAAHTGFILLGLVAANEPGFHGMAFYAGTYVFSALGAFGIVVLLRQKCATELQLTDLHGLYRSSPIVAWLFLFFLLALAGAPPTAGFFAKYYIVKGLLAAPHPELAVFTVLNALLSAYAYARVAVHASKQRTAAPGIEPAARGAELPSEEAPPLTISSGQTIALTVAAFVSLAAGLYPAPFLRLASYVFGQ